MMAWGAVLLLWISPIFGGEFVDDQHIGRPITVAVVFPTQAGCQAMLKALKKATVRHQVIQECTEVTK